MIQIPLTAELRQLRMEEIAQHVISTPKTPFGEITIRDLMLNETWLDQKIFDIDEKSAFGFGVYVFFLQNNEVYIGKVVSNFKHRMLSHQAFDNRVNFGFNRLAKYIYENKTGKPYDKSTFEEFETEVLPDLKKLPVCLLNCHGTNITTKACDRLERLLTKGFQETGYKIISNTKGVSRYKSSLCLETLLNIAQ